MIVVKGRIIKRFMTGALSFITAALLIFVSGCSMQGGLNAETDDRERSIVQPFNEQETMQNGTEYPLRFELDSGMLEVVDLTSGEKSTHLSIRLIQVPAFRVFPADYNDDGADHLRERLNEQLKAIYLRDERGREYRFQSGDYRIDHLVCSACATGVSWSSDVYLELPLLEPGWNEITLIIPLPGDASIEVVVL